MKIQVWKLKTWTGWYGAGLFDSNDKELYGVHAKGAEEAIKLLKENLLRERIEAERIFSEAAQAKIEYV